MTKEKSVRNKIAAIIHSKDSNAEAYLFGSRARGDANSDSDWDVLILVDETKVTNELDDKFRTDLYNLSLDSNNIISLFIYPKKFWKEKLALSPLYENIVNEGIKL